MVIGMNSEIKVSTWQTSADQHYQSREESLRKSAKGENRYAAAIVRFSLEDAKRYLPIALGQLYNSATRARQHQRSNKAKAWASLNHTITAAAYKHPL